MHAVISRLERVVRYVLLKPVYGKGYADQNWSKISKQEVV